MKKTINIRYICQLLLHRWYWFVIAVAVAIVAYLTIIRVSTPKYKVTTSMVIRSTDRFSSQISQLGILSLLGMGSDPKIDNDMEWLNSDYIIEEAIKSLDLQTEYRASNRKGHLAGQYPNHDLDINYPDRFLDTLYNTTIVTLKPIKNGYKVTVKYGKNTRSKHTISTLTEPFNSCIGTISFAEHTQIKPQTTYRFITRPQRVLVSDLHDQIEILRLNKKAYTINIQSETDMPRRAIDVITQMIRAFNQNAIEEYSLMSNDIQNYIEERLAIVKLELDSIEREEEKFKNDNRLLGISDEALLYLRQEQAYQQKKAEIETQLSLVDYVENFITSEDSKYAPVPAAIGIEDASLVSLIDEYNLLLLKRLKMLRTATADNPIVAQMEEQLTAMRSNVLSGIRSVKEGLTIMQRDMRKNEKQFEGKINEMPHQEREYVQLMRNKMIKQELYTILYQKQEENAFSLAPNMEPAKVIDSPRRSFYPTSPHKMRILVLLLFLAIACPLGILLVQMLISQPLTNYADIEECDLTNIGYIYNGKEIRKNTIIAAESAAYPQIRKIVTELIGRHSDKPTTVLVTSHKQGEGKTVVTTNIVRYLAKSNYKVLLLDCTTQKKAVQILSYTPSSGEVVLTSESAFCLKQRSIIEEELKKLSEGQDFVIILTDDMSNSSDCNRLKDFADYTLFVVREGRSDSNVLDRLLTYQEKALFPNILVCLTDCHYKWF